MVTKVSENDDKSWYYSLLEKVSRTLELEPLLQHIGQAVLRIAQVDGVAILLKDPVEPELRYDLIILPEQLADISGAYRKLAVKLEDDYEITTAFSEGKTIIVDLQTVAAAHENTRIRFERWQLQSMLVAPLCHEGSPIGVVMAFRSGRDFGEDSVDLIRTIVEAFSTQIVNSAAHSRLYDKMKAIENAARERTRFLEFISELNSLTASEQIFQMIADEFLRHYGFDLAFFSMIEGENLRQQCFRVGAPEFEPVLRVSEDYYGALGGSGCAATKARFPLAPPGTCRSMSRMRERSSICRWRRTTRVSSTSWTRAARRC